MRSFVDASSYLWRLDFFYAGGYTTGGGDGIPPLTAALQLMMPTRTPWSGCVGTRPCPGFAISPS